MTTVLFKQILEQILENYSSDVNLIVFLHDSKLLVLILDNSTIKI